MRRSSRAILMVLLLPVAGLLAQSRAEKLNDFTLELGGKCISYSLAYQRMVGEKAGLEVGLSYIGGSEGSGGGVFFLSGGARLYLTKKNASPCLSGGIVYVSEGTDLGPFGEESSLGVYLYASPGFEYRISDGFLFRGSVNFLIKNGLFVWPGLTLGIAF